MRAVPRHRSTLRLILGIAVGLGHAATASAARPATHIDPAAALRAIHASPTSLHAGGARGGQRGGFVPAVRRHAPTPPPTTRVADSQQRSSVLARSDDGRRRPSDVRASLVTAAQRHVLDHRFPVASRDWRPTAPAGLFHEANAPPSAAAPTAAGLDA
jgi:hypothetical protein